MGDVAARAGVSRQLVSIIFRNEPGAGAETRARVLNAAEELGYRPDTAARMLRRKNSNVLGVSFRPQHAPESDVINGIYQEVEKFGYDVVLSAVTPERDEHTAVKELLGYRCEALIVIGSHLSADELRQLAARVPVVSVGGGRPVARPGCDVVRSAGDIGVAQAVDHLVELGHREIAYLHGQRMPSAKVRHEGYLRAMRRHELPARTVMTPDDYIEESGATAADTLLAEDVLPTAIVAGNDHAALGLIHALLRAGVTVPEHVSVTGFDGSRIAQLSYVDLTSVHQDGVQMGIVSVRAAVERITGERSDPTETVINPALVIRGSTAPPRSSAAVPHVTDPQSHVA
jgi:DNA-binding LacI/PurR family transcriptional regulator